MGNSNRIGIDASYLVRNQQGLGRCVRTVLSHWEEDPERFVLLTLNRRDLNGLRDYAQRGWHTCLYNEAPDLGVCWFPWNRLDWDPECPRAVMIHDVSPFTDYHPSHRHRDDEQARLAEAVRHADAVMTISSFSRAEIHHHLAYPLEDMEIFYWGVDQQLFCPHSLVRKDLLPEVLHDKPFLLYVGTLEPRKNVVGLLEAFALLEKQIPHLLVLVSPKPVTSWTDRLWGRSHQLETMARSFGSRVVWVDGVDDAELVELYRRCSLTVVPSFYEGFGLPILEGLACGTRVAAARASSLPEVGGTLTHWFNPKDSVDIARVVLDSLQAPAPPREEVDAHLKMFSWSQTSEEILHFLEEVARKPRRRDSGVFPSLPPHLQLPDDDD